MDYDIDKFKKDFIDYNFDKLFIEQNNILINNNDIYLQYKQDYLKKSLDNFNVLFNYINDYNNLKNNYIVKSDNNHKQHIYTINNKEELYNLNNNIKDIIKNQQIIYNHFINYINFLLIN